MFDKVLSIDDLSRADHYYIEESDNCFYFGEYTAREKATHSATNQLIINLKKPEGRKHLYEYRYKTKAIQQVSEILSKLINPSEITIVPVPPSKCRTDALYDDRMKKILDGFRSKNPAVDYREIVSQQFSMEASHNAQARSSPDGLAQNYQVDQQLCEGLRDTIVVFDDVLTAGAHFKAMQMVLRPHVGERPVMGLFIARTVRGAQLIPDFY